jgi:signal transduction histidine kinase
MAYVGIHRASDVSTMARVVRERSTSRRRTVIYSVGASVIVLLLVAGLAFANSISVTRVTNNARSLHWTNATMGTSALTRAGLAQAVTYAELLGDAVVTTADLDFAMEQVASSSGELEHLFEIGETHDSYADLARFIDPVSATVDALRRGEVDRAKELVETEVEAAYLSLVNSLHIEQDEIQAAIEENSQAGRALNAWVVFILTLAVPGSAVAVYFVVARRQVHAIEERTRVELGAEREISRAKDAFIAGLSHELRTPLTSIYGYAEILTEGGIQGVEATRETAQVIANEAAEMTRMVDDLLTASRLASTGVEVELVATGVHQVIEAAVLPFERAGLKVSREPSAAMVVADSARLRHVLVNLLSNVARHGGPNAGIEVTGGESTVDIEIWDDGPGVPEDRVESLFDRFAHSGDTPLLTGTVGLGLAVASRLTGLMGGRLRYQRYGAKTYFIVSMPAASVAAEGLDVDTESVASMIRALSS